MKNMAGKKSTTWQAAVRCEAEPLSSMLLQPKAAVANAFGQTRSAAATIYICRDTGKP